MQKGGVRIVDFADRYGLILFNTTCIKRLFHLLAIYAGNSKTRVDYILIRRHHFLIVINGKTVSYRNWIMAVDCSFANQATNKIL